MATEPQPKHPLGQMTTAELATYKRELEHSLKYLPAGAPVRGLLNVKLQGVLDEQRSRDQLARANGGC